MKPMRVAVLMGGDSTERAVSLRSGRAVAQALRSRGHLVAEVDVKSAEMRELDFLRVDMCFIAIHGGFGEDGRLQRRLEEMGIPYTGSGRAASEFAIDKLKSKMMFLLLGVPTPRYHVVRAGDSVERGLQMAGQLGFPVVLKPRDQGSSVGVSIVRAPEELAGALKDVRKFGPVAIMEEFVRGRELTVGIVCGRVLPVIELRPARDFFDYRAKYEDPETRYLVDPEDLDPVLKARVKAAALQAHAALHCEDLSRVDVMLGEDGRPYVLEVNTIPGMTERSLLPKGAAAAGVGYPELCEMLLTAAIDRAMPLAEVA
jgi:D-alanine-D-alanine ligase